MLTPTEHQLKNIELAVDWYRTAKNAVFDIYETGKTGLGNGQDFFFGGYAGTGKSQPLDSVVQTPKGPVKIGNLHAGDSIFSRDGTLQTVTGVFPQGKRPTYRITFRDRTSTLCSDNHLWYCQTSRQKVRGTHQILTTQQIADKGVLRPSGDMRFQIPVCAAVAYSKKELPIHPYILGLLLGDGSLNKSVVVLTVADSEFEYIFNRVAVLVPDFVRLTVYQSIGCKKIHFCDAVLGTKNSRFKSLLKDLGLLVHGNSKHIPLKYKYSDVSDRTELIRGMMDSDGSVGNNRTRFSNKTKVLVEDFCEVVRSLGGISTIRENCRPDKGIEYDVGLRVAFCPFSIPSKTVKWSPSKKNPPSKYIRSIKYVGDMDNVCISVSSPDKLYLTDDFIVTHNTTVLPYAIEKMGLTPDQISFCAPTGKAAKVISSKLQDFGLRVTATTIHKLIYLPKGASADRIQSTIEGVNTQIINYKLGKQTTIVIDNRPYSLPDAEKRLKELSFDLARAMDNDDGPTFMLRPRTDFNENTKLIIVDEGSMVGTTLAEDLASFGVPILAFGDPGQLPPVGEDYGLNCETPDAFLTEIHRQAKDNPIIYLATRAREGKDLVEGDYGQNVKVVSRRKDTHTLDMSREAMVLCGTHKKRWGLTKQIRNALGYTETGPGAGEPLLFCKNSQKLEAMVNGTVVECVQDCGDLSKGAATLSVKVKDVEGGGAEYTVEAVQGLFEEHLERKRNAYSASPQAAFRAKKNAEHLDFGHVLTVHKSQGSQWDDVIVHDESSVFKDAASRWLYTGITRAAKQLTVVI